jgi:hypothetical protein
VAAHIVTFDADVTVISFQQSGTGKFVLGNGRTVTGNVTINVGTFVTGGTVECVATTTATINGNVSGPTDTTGVNVTGVVMNGTGSLTINGTITGTAGNVSGEANRHACVYINVVSSVTVNGDVRGGANFKLGIQTGLSASGVLNLNATSVASGTGVAAYGVRVEGDITLNIIATSVAGINTTCLYLSGNSPTVNITAGTMTTGGPAGGNCLWALGLQPKVTITATTMQAGFSGTSTNRCVNLSGNGNAMLTVTANDIYAGNSTNNNGIAVVGVTSVAYVTGRVFAGTGSNAHGIEMNGTSSFLTLIGSAQANGISHGVFSSSTTFGVALEGDMTGSQIGGVAVYTRIFRMTATNSGVTRYTTSDGSGSLVSRVSPDNATGVPDQDDVRGGTLYGYNNELSGSLAMPPVQAVKYGVPVNNTTGTGEFDLDRTVAVLAEAIALCMSAGSRQ